MTNPFLEMLEMMNAMGEATVMVIESRNADDHFKGRQEGVGLCELLKLSGIEHRYREVINREFLTKALLEVGYSEARYVHISCHGNSKGIELSDGDFVTWDEFHDLVWSECGKALAGRVLVFSACAVGRGIGVLLKKHSTFCARIVAPTRKIYWDEGLAAYSTFYFRTTKKKNGTSDDVALMNKIVGSKTFVQFKGYRPDTYTTT